MESFLNGAIIRFGRVRQSTNPQNQQTTFHDDSYVPIYDSFHALEILSFPQINSNARNEEIFTRICFVLMAKYDEKFLYIYGTLFFPLFCDDRESATFVRW